jgi:hypothetical protein
MVRARPTGYCVLISRRCSSFEAEVLVVRRCHPKCAVTWGNWNYTLVITTRHFAPYSVLSRNIRGTRGTSGDRPPMGLRDSADSNSGRPPSLAVGLQRDVPGSCSCDHGPDTARVRPNGTPCVLPGFH